MNAQQVNSLIARFAVDEVTARRLADALAERLANDTAVAAYEDGGGWVVEIYFSSAPDEGSVRALIGELVGARLGAGLEFVTLAARDWVAASLAGLPPVIAG